MGKKGKKKRKSGIFGGAVSRESPAFKGFSKMVYLAFPMITVAFILWNFQTAISGIPLFNLLITLGGLQTYNQGVVGIMVVILVLGSLLIMWFDD